MRGTRQMRRVGAAAVLALAIAALLAIPSLAGAVTIKGSSTSSYRFAPKHLTVNKGATVHWHWNSNAAHNVTFSGAKHSSTKAKGSYKLKFKHKGIFKYVCTIHGTRGSIIVK